MGMSPMATPRKAQSSADMVARPRGYTRTNIGVIPEEWMLERLSSLVDPQRGIRYGIVQPGKEDPDGRFMVRGQDYAEGWADPSTIFRVGAQTEERYRNARVRTGDLLITIVGASTGRVAVVPEWLDQANITQTTARIAIDPCRADSSFCMHMLQSRVGASQTANYIKGGAQPGLNCCDLAKFLIPLPPTGKEQRAIAEALSDVDGLIGALEALIAKKRAIQQAAMQQLLTGKTRLPGFTEKWETKQLGDIADLHRQNVVPATVGDLLFTHFSLPAFDEGQAPIIEPGCEIGSNKFRVPDNAVLVSKLNPRIPRVWMPVGKIQNAVASTEFLVLTPQEGISRHFLYVICSSPMFCEQMELSATGTTGSHQRISPTTALKIRVRLSVDPEEQAAIAGVLSDMDAEIAALERRRDKTKQIKQGMMQQLLTGRIRLVKAEETQ